MQPNLELTIRNTGGSVIGSALFTFLVFWLTIGRGILGDAELGSIDGLIAILGVIIWVVGAVVLLTGGLRALLGREHIIVADGTIYLDASVMGMFAIRRRFPIAELRSIEVEMVTKRWKGTTSQRPQIVLITARERVPLLVRLSRRAADELVTGPLRALLPVKAH